MLLKSVCFRIVKKDVLPKGDYESADVYHVKMVQYLWQFADDKKTSIKLYKYFQQPTDLDLELVEKGDGASTSHSNKV